MKVTLARTAGFCMGVKRAVELVLNEANKFQNRIVTYGPLIHNSQVLELLAEKNINISKDISAFKGDETIVIRAHGIPPKEKHKLEEVCAKVIDATCPRVVKVQMIIKSKVEKGMQAIIVGDRDHAEIMSLQGFADNKAYVIDSTEDVEALPDLDRVFVVAQTTQSGALFDEITEHIKKRWPDADIYNTICHGSKARQAEIKSLVKNVEGMVVVGGAFSANTQRLAKIASEAGAKTFLIESADQLDLEEISKLESVGVTAGASTPSWMIRQVVEKLRGVKGKGESRIKSSAYRIFRFLLKSNTLVAAGGSSLALAAWLSSGLAVDWRLAVVPFCYLYAMHILNHFVDRKAAIYIDPDRANFFLKHKNYLWVTSYMAVVAGLGSALGLGYGSFFTLLALIILGLGYSVRLIPEKWAQKVSYTKMKDFPGSKPAVIAMAWAAVCGLWPAIAYNGIFSEAICLGFIIGLASFCRAVFFDVTDVQGDLAVGKETLAINLGEKKTLKLLKVFLTIQIISCVILTLTGLINKYAAILVLSGIGLFAILHNYEKQQILSGSILEGKIEAAFLITGIGAAFIHFL